MEHIMKRIVNGLTYNTETSRLVAKSEWEVGDTNSPYYGMEREGELYQTRGGAFFLVTTTHVPETRDSEARDKVECDPLTSKRAQAWINDGDVEVFNNPFEEPPEATAEGETSGTIYARMTASLKRDVEAAAGKVGVSANVWVTRCLEQCLRNQKAG
jgi:HicB family